MLGFIQHRSTGDMLAEFATPLNDARSPQRPPNEIKGSPNSNNQLEVEDEEDELGAPCRPLLLTADQPNTERAARLASAKYSAGNQNYSCRQQQPQVARETLNRWPLERQFKSIGDFLAINMEPASNNKAEHHLIGKVDSCAPHESAQEDNELNSTTTTTVAASKTKRKSPAAAAPPARQRHLTLSKLRAANGAQKWRRREARTGRYLASLSLSSPVLSQSSLKSAEMNGGGQLCSEDNKAALLDEVTVPTVHDKLASQILSQVDAACETKEFADRLPRIVVAVEDELDSDGLAHSALSSNSSGCYSTCEEGQNSCGEAEEEDVSARRLHLGERKETQQVNASANDNHLNQQRLGANQAERAYYSASSYIVPTGSREPSMAESSCPINIMSDSQLASRQQDIHKRRGSEHSNNVDSCSSDNNNTAVQCAPNIQQVLSLTTHAQSQVDRIRKRQQQVRKTEREKEKETETTSATGTQHRTTGSLMVDLNGFTSKIMGSPGHSWRQALQPGHSGSYKVTKAHLTQVTISAAASGQQEKQQHSQQQQWPTKQENRVDKVNSRESSENRRISRYSRPGRSPVSLQRHTNARLIKHRLKIQQQRQEQLAQIALRERRQLDRRSNIQYQHRPVTTRAELTTRDRLSGEQLSESSNNQRQATTNIFQESLQLVHGLRDRLLLNNNNDINNITLPKFTKDQPSLPTSTVQQQDRTSTCSRLEQQQYRRQNQHQLQPHLNNKQRPYQVITPNTSRAIEICDNQLACSSRQDRLVASDHQNHQSAITVDIKQPKRTSPGGNVIAYNSINMLRPIPLDCKSARDSYKRYETKCDEVIESEDEQTTASSDGSSLSLNKPFCKICHIGSSKNGDKLISPCRCAGTMQYIHCGCLLKWLQISNRTHEKPVSCELCAHEYSWHKKFNLRQVRMPKCSMKDVLLHVIFIAAVGVMLMSALAPMLHKRSSPSVSSASLSAQSSGLNSGHRAQGSSDSTSTNNGELNSRGRHHMSVPLHHSSSFNGQANHLATSGRLASDEKFMLLCAASFFISFFLAIYVQTKARDTLYSLVVKFLAMNQTYYITEYDHGQFSGGNNANNINNNNNGIGSGSSSSGSSGSSSGNSDSDIKRQQYQQQHQQQFYSVNSRSDRKNSVKS